MDSIPQKRCRKCGEEKPATTEYFHNDPRGLFKLKASCKICQALYDKTRNSIPGNKERSCARAKEYRDANPEYYREKSRQYEINHRDERNKQRREREAAKAPSERVNKRYKDKNPEKVKHLNYAWRDKNPEQWAKILRKSHQKRRAQKHQASGQYTQADLDLQYKSQHEKCWWCGDNLNGVYHPDHLIALSRGGTNKPNNIVLACPSCNLSKYNKLPWEWIGRLL